MTKILKEMQFSVEKYAAVLSDVLQVDVEIADETLERISGTGAFKYKVNKTMTSEGGAYQEVLRTGRMQIIERPGEEPVCEDCPKYGRCDETYEISTPIKLRGQVIGVIGFVCFTKKQKKHLLDNFKTFVEFSGQISDLIASKAGEKIENHKNLVFLDLLKKITNTIDQGVLVLDEHSRVQNINILAEKMLGLKVSGEGERIEVYPTGNFVLGERELCVNVGGETFFFVGKHYDIKMDNYHVLYLLKDAELMKSYALSVSTSQQKIGLDRTKGESQAILDLKETVRRVAKINSTVLITGESGTGKELLARALHEESHRAEAPFVAINCGAIPENLIESELFGYEKGAFTGANPKGKMGKFELANGGTLFLDEVGDMPLYLQVKLLRALEEREICRVGSTRLIKVDIRVVAATNKNLEILIKENRFREDLFYRLNVIPLSLPALRERGGDIRLLSQFFIQKYASIFDKKVVAIDDAFWKSLEAYSWPGNIRELQNTIEHVVIMLGSSGFIGSELLPKTIKSENISLEVDDFNLERMEKKLIKKALDLYGTDIEAKNFIAKKLGIGIATLYRKIKKYELP